jgi:hypothetical protein
VLLRADSLDALGADDVRHLRDEIGVAAVVDLRRHTEHLPTPPAYFAEGPWRRHALPLVEEGALAATDAAAAFPEAAANLYDWMIATAGGRVVEIFDLAVGLGGRGAMVVHCAAGKDRTGIVVAVLLLAAGVDEEEVIADYHVTEQRMEAVRAALRASGVVLSGDALVRYRELARRDLLGAPRVAMQGAITHLNERFGGAAGYLQAHGASAESITRWREILIAPDPA